MIAAPYGNLSLQSNGFNKWTIVGDGGGAWAPYTPIISPTSGAVTSYTVTGRYKKIGVTVFVQIMINVTTNGTASGGIRVTLPTAAAAFNYILSGRENNITGKSLCCVITSGSNSCFVSNYDGSYPAANGASLVLSGVYESLS